MNIGPLRGRAAARDLSDQLTSLFLLRHCGRALRRRDHPSIYGQMGRCCSPCLGDLDPNAYRRQVDAALGLFEGPEPDAARRLIDHVTAEMEAASQARRYEHAATLRRRRERLEGVLGRLEGVLRATHAARRLVLAPHPTKDRHDALWLVGGRVADWGPLPGPTELTERTQAALARRADRAPVPPEEVDEIRIVNAWLAEHEPPTLALDGDADPGAWAAEAAQPVVRQAAGSAGCAA